MAGTRCGTQVCCVAGRGWCSSTLGHLLRCHSVLQVEMGPFRHTVDDGLDVRKAAFECMYSLLESCLGQLDICEFLNHVEDGLKDHYDIRVGVHPWPGPCPPWQGTARSATDPPPGTHDSSLLFSDKKREPAGCCGSRL